MVVARRRNLLCSGLVRTAIYKDRFPTSKTPRGQPTRKQNAGLQVSNVFTVRTGTTARALELPSLVWSGSFFFSVCLKPSPRGSVAGVCSPPHPREGISDVLAGCSIFPVFTVSQWWDWQIHALPNPVSNSIPSLVLRISWKISVPWRTCALASVPFLTKYCSTVGAKPRLKVLSVDKINRGSTGMKKSCRNTSTPPHQPQYHENQKNKLKF